MKGEKDMITLDDVLDFYLASSEDAGEDALAQMIRSYPQFANDLREFAALRKVNVLVPDPELTEDHQLRLSARAVSVVQNALFRKREESASGSPEALSSLRDEVDSKYRDANEFYQRTELSEGIIWTLDDRQVLFETIPRKAIENIADALGKLFDTVAAYLQGEMQLDPSFYKAEQTPEVVARISFVDLLKIDDDLTPEQKTFWLSQNPVTAGAAQENKGTNH
jgi:hypothetical protein